MVKDKIVATCKRNGIPGVITENELKHLEKAYHKHNRVEDMKFTCALCNASIKNIDGQYIKYDKSKSVKVCKIHVPDARANKKEVAAYKFCSRYDDEKEV